MGQNLRQRLNRLRVRINNCLADAGMLHRYGAGVTVDRDTGDYLLAVTVKDDNGRRCLAAHKTAAVFRGGRAVVKNTVVMTGVLSDVLDILREEEAAGAR